MIIPRWGNEQHLSLSLVSSHLSFSLALLVSRALVLQLLQHKFNLEDYLFLSSPQGPENLFYETAALI